MAKKTSPDEKSKPTEVKADEVLSVDSAVVHNASNPNPDSFPKDGGGIQNIPSVGRPHKDDRDSEGSLPETNATQNELAEMGAHPSPKVLPPRGMTDEDYAKYQKEELGKVAKAESASGALSSPAMGDEPSK